MRFTTLTAAVDGLVANMHADVWNSTVETVERLVAVVEKAEEKTRRGWIAGQKLAEDGLSVDLGFWLIIAEPIRRFNLV